MRAAGYLTGLILCLLLGNFANAAQYAFVVSFTDKSGSLTISDSATFLSQRALDRRHKYHIAVDSTDIPVTPAYIDSVLTLTGGALHVKSRWQNLCVVLLSDSTQILNLQGKPYISSIKYVAYYGGILHNKIPNPNGSTGTATVIPGISKTTSDFGNTWGQTHLVHGEYLHDQGYMGDGILIAVFDEGFAGTNTHPGFDSMRSSGGLLDSFNFVLKTNNIFNIGNSHGTSALSTMAGNIVNTGGTTYVGAAPHAQYALYISEDGGSEQPIELYNMMAATERADSLGADIISESLGYDIFTDFHSADFTPSDFDGKSTVTARMANMATQKGMLFVATAGNDGSWGILTPGEADSALTIGAVDLNKVSYGSSGYGPNAAGIVKPDVCGMGVGTAVFSSGAYTNLFGTSFSTPQIAGWAACLLQASPNATPYMIRTAIQKSADHYTNPQTQLGYGIPDFMAAAQMLKIIDTPEPSEMNRVSAGPNPFYNYISFNISLPSNQPVQFSLTDITGKQVFTDTRSLYFGFNTHISFNVPAALPKSIYFMHVVSSTINQVLKLEKL